MKKNIDRKYSMQGQAILELLISLIVFMACMLGLIFVGGITLGSIELLLDSRADADQHARYSTEGSDGQEIDDWSYSEALNKDGEALTIPFLVDDDYSDQSDNLSQFYGTINNKSYSNTEQATSDGVIDDSYYFNTFNEMPNNEYSFGATGLSSGRIAASLHEGDGSVDNMIVTLGKVSNRDQVFEAIRILSSGSIDVDKIENAQSNKAYVPSMKLQIIKTE